MASFLGGEIMSQLYRVIRSVSSRRRAAIGGKIVAYAGSAVPVDGEKLSVSLRPMLLLLLGGASLPALAQLAVSDARQVAISSSGSQVKMMQSRDQIVPNLAAEVVSPVMMKTSRSNSKFVQINLRQNMQAAAVVPQCVAPQERDGSDFLKNGY